MDKKTKLSEAISYIDDDLIEEADEVRRNSVSVKGRVIRLGKWAKYGAVAAAGVLVIGGGIYTATRFGGGSKEAAPDGVANRSVMLDSEKYNVYAPQSTENSQSDNPATDNMKVATSAEGGSNYTNGNSDMSSFSCKITDVTNVSAKLLFEFSQVAEGVEVAVKANDDFSIESYNSETNKYDTLFSVGDQKPDSKTDTVEQQDDSPATKGSTIATSKDTDPQITLSLDWSDKGELAPGDYVIRKNVVISYEKDGVPVIKDVELKIDFHLD